MYIRTDVWKDKEFCALKSTCMYVWRDEKEEKKLKYVKRFRAFSINNATVFIHWETALTRARHLYRVPHNSNPISYR